MRQVLPAVGWFALGVVVLGGCNRDEHTERLKLHALEARSVAVDRPFELSGADLPTGAAAKLILQGVMHAPARAERSVRLVLPARVLSPERIQAQVSELIEELGRGSFEGRMEVHANDATAQPFSGALERVAFDVDGPTVAASEQLRRGAAALLETIGVEASGDEALNDGLVVAALRAESPAVRAGLRVADVVESVNGVRVHALVDFAPAPLARSLQLQVLSPGGLHRALSVSLSPSAGLLLEPRTLRWFVLGCPMLLLVLWLAPWPRLRSLSWRVLAQLRAAYSPTALGSEKLGVALSCLCGGLVATLLPVLDVSTLLISHAFLYVWLQWLRKPASPAWVGHVLVLWTCVLCTAAISGTRSLLGIGNDQGPLPWEWNAFTRPPLALAFALSVWHAGRLHPAGAPRAKTRVLDTSARAVLAALLSALYLAGPRTGWDLQREGAALGGALLAIKSLAVYALIHRASTLESTALPKLVRWFAPALLPVLTGIWLWLALNHQQELGVGIAVLVAGGLCAALALLEQTSQQRRPPQLRTRSLPLPMPTVPKRVVEGSH